MSIIHTSNETIGQVYLPGVNWLMLTGTVLLVLGFKDSGSLAGAYGVAVAMTMLITTFLIIAVMRFHWRWAWPVVILTTAPFLLLDSAFFGSTILKIRDGGWVPLLIAAASILVMMTWHRGRKILGQKMAEASVSIDDFLKDVAISKPLRVPGTAIFLTGNPNGIPRTLLHNFKHNKILHNHIILLSIRTEHIPVVSVADRSEIKVLNEGFYQILIRYGFSEDPNIPNVLSTIQQEGLSLLPMGLTFFLGRETLILTDERNMLSWRKMIFSFLSRNAWDASKFFRIPPNRVIEIGIQVEL